MSGSLTDRVFPVVDRQCLTIVKKICRVKIDVEPERNTQAPEHELQTDANRQIPEFQTGMVIAGYPIGD